MSKNFTVSIAIILLFLATSCEKEYYKASDIDESKEYSFKDDINPIFTDKCVICHGGSTAPNLKEDPYAIINTPKYINADSPEESLIYTMPKESHPGKYTPEQAKSVLKWIEQGAKNN